MQTLVQIIRVTLPALGITVLFYSLFSLFRKPKDSGTGVFLQNPANNDIYPLQYGETSIGRSKICDIMLNYPTVSRSHAVLAQRKKGWSIVDTRSTTGTKVNEEPVKKRVYLEEGDLITLGGISLIFSGESETADIPIDKNV
ncbi:MAG TPA: FHA domain-containing protein [Clostridia bacterium]|nr:FHA domain-containing protein [Clostridia bacterium]